MSEFLRADKAPRASPFTGSLPNPPFPPGHPLLLPPPRTHTPEPSRPADERAEEENERNRRGVRNVEVHLQRRRPLVFARAQRVRRSCHGQRIWPWNMSSSVGDRLASYIRGRKMSQLITASADLPLAFTACDAAEEPPEPSQGWAGSRLPFLRQERVR